MFRSTLTKGAIALVMTFLIGLFGAWVTQASRSAAVSPQIVANPVSVVQSPGGNNTPANVVSPALTWGDCTPARVAVFATRIHVKCAAGISGIWYFAYPTSDAAGAARVLSVLNSALVTGRTLVILYDPSDTTSGPPIGCAASDCRLLQALEVK
ncbi:MAG: hypothetical protein GXP41_07745 [Chloroflexi bacterium]|nr:hypothetical protein [Chloroflexota bacterium]